MIKNPDPDFPDIPANPLALRPQKTAPALDMPGIVVIFALVLIFIHLIRITMLSQEHDALVILALSFIPVSYSDYANELPFPLCGLWTPFTYSLLHFDTTHVMINSIWMFIFGTPVARRFGAVGFLLLSAIASAAGAGLHFVFYPFDYKPVIGASACVSGYMGAAARFALQKTFTAGQAHTAIAHKTMPALTIIQALQNRRSLAFAGIWMGLNFIIGSGMPDLLGSAQSIAWQAHIGGFLAGILLFDLFERGFGPNRYHDNKAGDKA